MAKDLERWTERTPERASVFDRAPARFGLARQAECIPDPIPAAPSPDPDPPLADEEPGSFLTYLCLPWSYGDHEGLADRWRRSRCRRGRHEMIGGQAMQMGGSVAYIERRCRWCGTE